MFRSVYFFLFRPQIWLCPLWLGLLTIQGAQAHGNGLVLVAPRQSSKAPTFVDYASLSKASWKLSANFSAITYSLSVLLLGSPAQLMQNTGAGRRSWCCRRHMHCLTSQPCASHLDLHQDTSFIIPQVHPDTCCCCCMLWCAPYRAPGHLKLVFKTRLASAAACMSPLPPWDIT